MFLNKFNTLQMIINNNNINISKSILICFLLSISIFLFNDANTFSLYPADSITGREYGCYTEIENLIGIKSPSIIRSIEYLVVILIFIICLIFSIKTIKRNIKKCHI